MSSTAHASAERCAGGWTAGCTDPSAANYDPSATSDDGSCTFVFEEAGKEVEISGNLHDYVVTALQSLWGALSLAVALQRRRLQSRAF
jgi:hypothetical protein